MTFDRRELHEFGLLSYLTLPCDCWARFAIKSVIAANAVRHYRLVCTECHRFVGGQLPYDLLSDELKRAAEEVANNLPPIECARCHGKHGVERHHWAPFGIFVDAHAWPTSWLCRSCHHEWHVKMKTAAIPRTA
jgi:hypothetical protein